VTNLFFFFLIEQTLLCFQSYDLSNLYQGTIKKLVLNFEMVFLVLASAMQQVSFFFVLIVQDLSLTKILLFLYTF